MAQIALTDLRRTAAEILAAAVIEIFPNVQLIAGYVTHSGFCYDFLFPFEFQKEFLTLIEEKMRAILKEKRPIKMLEMVPRNAAQFFEHHRQMRLSEKVSEIEETLVTIFQMGEFNDLAPPPYLANSGEIGFFKLLEFFKVGKEGITRVIGTSFPDQKSLKDFVRSKETLKDKDHLFFCKDMKLLGPYPKKEGYWLWHPKGESIRQVLIDFWKEESIKQNFQFVASPPLFLEEGSVCPIPEIAQAHAAINKENFPGTAKLAELTYVDRPIKEHLLADLLNSQGYFSDIAHLFCSEPDLLKECISSLQFIIQIPKIFGFEHQLVLCSPTAKGRPLYPKDEELFKKAAAECRFEFQTDGGCDGGVRFEVRIKDLLGREWTGPYLGAVHLKGVPQKILVRSMFSSLERFVALLLERYEGVLPFWLSPEQVRICTVNEQAGEYALRIKAVLQTIGIRTSLDVQKGQLGKRVHDALRERVPYCIVVGEKEEKSVTVALKACGSDRDELLSLEELKQRLLALKWSK